MSRFDPYEHLGIRPNPDGTITLLSHFPKTEANPGVIPGLPLPPKMLPSMMKQSAANLSTHQPCSALASEIPAIVIAVDHRLAPDHRLPAQYEDATDAILWVKKQALDPEGETWLRNYGDFTRCYLGGRGSGGNMAFHAAVRVPNIDIKPLNIIGIFLNQPMFGGKERMPSELQYATDQLIPLPVLDLLWEFALPKGTDRDHRFCNPLKDGAYKSKVSSIGRCLVVSFNMDLMLDRVQAFVQMLVKQGVQVEARFDEGIGIQAKICDPDS
ncbi:hypothetical protein REPUB_Repub12eG0191100 [Reevesia pubescens]